MKNAISALTCANGFRRSVFKVENTVPDVFYAGPAKQSGSFHRYIPLAALRST